MPAERPKELQASVAEPQEELTLVPVRYRIGSRGTELTHIEIREQRDGKDKWAVVRMGMVLNRAGEWEYEPLPSSRSDAFIRRTRFEAPVIALAAYSNRQKGEPERG